jgi:hypothetical protein
MSDNENPVTAPEVTPAVPAVPKTRAKKAPAAVEQDAVETRTMTTNGFTFIIQG